MEINGDVHPAVDFNPVIPCTHWIEAEGPRVSLDVVVKIKILFLPKIEVQFSSLWTELSYITFKL
jgi:hypothetical protein